MNLTERIKEIENSDVGREIESRINEFKAFREKDDLEWFSELCFCLLTANSKAESAINIQNELGIKGFVEYNEEEVKKVIRNNNHRFHNNKARFIVNARQYLEVKKIVQKKGEKEAREWLVDNIKGMGWKEASHFLRNVGYLNVAILDRHILRIMKENGMIKEIPKGWTKQKYHDIEEKLYGIAKELNMEPGKLDMYMWYMKTGKVLK